MEDEMTSYYVNKNAQPTGEHEVHKADCPTPPNYSNRQPVGEHSNCRSAVAAARAFYINVDGCANCSPECHKR
jgi:hypothetical protein